MNRKILNMFLPLLMIFFSCEINRLNQEKTVITLKSSDIENPVQISVIKGPQWSHKITPGPFVIHIYPQIVFWLEDDKGSVFKTLYITGANGSFSRHSTKRRLGARFFEECFPVWAEKVLRAGNSLPTAEHPYPDAVTCATPQSSFDLNLGIGQIPETSTVYAEINKTGDYNSVYTEENSQWSGQPSVVYAAEIRKPVRGQIIRFKPVGYSRAGSSPVLQYGFEGLDTALEMVDEMTVMFKEAVIFESGFKKAEKR